MVPVVLGCCALTRLCRAAQLGEFTSPGLIFILPLSPHGRGSKALQNGCGLQGSARQRVQSVGAQGSAVVEVDRGAAVKEGGHQEEK
jgi:hypothetical protein